MYTDYLRWIAAICLLASVSTVSAIELCAELHPEAHHRIPLDEPIFDSDGEKITSIYRRREESNYKAFTTCFNQRYGANVTAHEFLGCYHIAEFDVIGRVSCYIAWGDRLITDKVCIELGVADKYTYMLSDCFNEFWVLKGWGRYEPEPYGSPPKSIEQLKAEVLELLPQIEEQVDEVVEKFRRDIERQAASERTL